MPTRDQLVEVWIQRHREEIHALDPATKRRSNGEKPVHLVLRSLATDAAGWFPDLPPLQVLGGDVRVARNAEDSDDGDEGSGALLPTGRVRTNRTWRVELQPAERSDFAIYLDRIGPVAIEVVRQAFLVIRDSAFKTALLAAGVPAGSSRGQAGSWATLSGEGVRLLMLIRLGTVRHVDRTDATADGLRWDHYLNEELPGVVVKAAEGAIRTVLEWAPLRHEISVGLADLNYPEILMRATGECDSTCPPGRGRVSATPRHVQKELRRLVDRWSSRQPPWHDAVNTEMAVRLAHTIVDPNYYRQTRGALLQEFEASAEHLIRARFRYGQRLDEDCVQHSYEQAWSKLRDRFLDYHVNPRREPPGWATGGWRALLQYRCPPPDKAHLWAAGADGDVAATPSPIFSESPICRRIEQDPTYRQLQEQQLRHTTRQPQLGITRITLIAGLLAVDALENATIQTDTPIDRLLPQLQGWLEDQLPVQLHECWVTLPEVDRHDEPSLTTLRMVLSLLQLGPAISEAHLGREDEQVLVAAITWAVQVAAQCALPGLQDYTLQKRSEPREEDETWNPDDQ